MVISKDTYNIFVRHARPESFRDNRASIVFLDSPVKLGNVKIPNLNKEVHLLDLDSEFYLTKE